ncbi:MAG: xylulokinase, partial [Kiritimatiellia bacterium]
MNDGLLLGIDFGTGGCKLTLLDLSGRVVDSRAGEYPTRHPRPGWSEQDPADWYAVLLDLLRQLPRRNAVVAIALDSYTHGAVLLDEALAVIRPTIIWTDQRSVAQCKKLRAEHADLIFRTAYQMPAPTWTLPQMMWLREHEPDLYKKIRHILFVKDYVRYLLTGEMACDFIEAQGPLFWDMPAGRWSDELCALAGIAPAVLPRVGNPLEVAGRITAGASAATGLPEGIPVIMGASDSAVEGYAAGAVAPGQCVLKLATAGNVNVMTAAPRPHPETLTYSHVVPDLWYTVTATNAAAVCQRWLRDRTGAAGYEQMNRAAAQSPAGANGVFFHPYLMGERSPYWDPDLRGSFTGLSMATTPGDLNRALLEGVAFSLRDCYRTIETLGLAVRDFTLIGGGARSTLWSQIVCDVFNAPVRRPLACDASFGSALLAGVGADVWPDALSA